jgi:hypothetical protein
MKRLIVAIGAALFLPQVGMAQTVWKCQVNGKTTFSDAPCPSSGTMLDQRNLNSNTIGAVRRQWSEESDQQEGGRQHYSPSGQASSCPSEREIKNMETSASSITIGKKEKAFLQDEVRRARQCAKGQGNYSSDDWTQLKETRDAQSSIRDGADARRKAEGIHSAADPAETRQTGGAPGPAGRGLQRRRSAPGTSASAAVTASRRPARPRLASRTAPARSRRRPAACR